MAAIRCPKCDIPLTGSEAALGKCPICQMSVTNVKPRERRSESTTSFRTEQPIARKNLGFLPLFGILFAGGAFFGFVQAALMGFRSGSGTYGVGGGVFAVYCVLYALGYVGNKKA